MFLLLISIVIGLFIAMLFVNIYFRLKVLKSYKVLMQNGVDLDAKHLVNKQKLENEVLPKHPHLKKEIETFVNHIQYSVKMATVLIFLITVFGAILMYYRE